MNLAFSTTLNQPMIWNPKLKGINSTANMLAKILTYVSQFFSLHVKMVYYLFLTYSLEF